GVHSSCFTIGGLKQIGSRSVFLRATRTCRKYSKNSGLKPGAPPHRVRWKCLILVTLLLPEPKESSFSGRDEGRIEAATVVIMLSKISKNRSPSEPSFANLQ